MSAAGTFIPPLFVFPRKRMVDSLMNGALACSVGTVNTRGSGYIDNNLFLRWMHLFVDTVGCKKTTPHLLLLDGHESHKTLDVILYARENGVVILTFPPHCTHRLQPLDRTFFRSLKAAYSRAVDNWMICNKHRPVTQFDVIPLFNEAYKTSATIASATNGFRAAGLWPFNDAKFDEELLATAPIQPTIQPAPGAGVAGVHVAPDIDREDEDAILPAPMDVVADVHVAPYTDREAAMRVLKACSPTSIVSAPGKTRTRVRVTNAVVTSSPYKNMMEDRIVAKATTSAIVRPPEKKSAKPVRTLPSRKLKKKKTSKKERCGVKRPCEDSSEDDEWPCLVCGEPFRSSRSGESWIQCQICHHWSHHDCTEGGKFYVCHNCASDSD